MIVASMIGMMLMRLRIMVKRNHGDVAGCVIRRKNIYLPVHGMSQHGVLVHTWNFETVG